MDAIDSSRFQYQLRLHDVLFICVKLPSRLLRREVAERIAGDRVFQQLTALLNNEEIVYPALS